MFIRLIKRIYRGEKEQKRRDTEEIDKMIFLRRNTYKNLQKLLRRHSELKYCFVARRNCITGMTDIPAKNYDEHLLRRPGCSRPGCHSIIHWLPCFSRMIIYIILRPSHCYTKLMRIVDAFYNWYIAYDSVTIDTENTRVLQ